MGKKFEPEARRSAPPSGQPSTTREELEALTRSLTAARDARDEAERIGVAKDQFMAVLAHELRTPLAALQMQVQLLRRTGGDAGKLERACDAVERSVRLQAQLVDDLLDVSRIVAGKLKVALEPVDLVGVVEAALDSMATLAEIAAIELHASLDRSVGAIAGDHTRLAQIISNVVGNAIKFTPPGGRVDVVLERAEGLAHLRVTDTGVGIEPDLLKDIFNRLKQGNVSTRHHAGLGLGLAIVRYLVDANGGSVRAESDGEGQGATFHITLPLVKVAQLPPADWRTRVPAEGAAPIPHPRRLAGRSVLVIENDTATRDALANMLRETGALVSAADSAEAGMTMFHELRPEVIICDIAMPGEDGHAFIRRLRTLSDARGGNTPALALTALTGEMHRRRSLEAGFQLYLSKPTDMNRLIEVVAHLLDGEPDAAPERLAAGRGAVRDLTRET